MTNEITIPTNAQELVFNVPAMGQMQQLANFMAQGKTTIPSELQGNVGDCMAVCMQAALWKMNPYAVAQKAFFVGGKIGYEGQLVNAAVTNSGAIEGRIKFEYHGPWEKVRGNFRMQQNQGKKPFPVQNWKPEDEEDIFVRVIATLTGESEPSTMDVYLKQCQPRNSTLWPTDPEQQISYAAVRKFARRFCPEVILGVYSDDELDPAPMREINPAPAEEKQRSFAAVEVKEVDPTPLIEAIQACTTIAALEKLLPKCHELDKTTEAYKKVREAYKAMDTLLKQPVNEPAPVNEPIDSDFALPVAHLSQTIADCRTEEELAEVEPHINEHSGDDLAQLMKEYAAKMEALTNG